MMTQQESCGFADDVATTTATDALTDVTTDAEGAIVARYDHESDPLSVALPELVAHCEQCHPCSLPSLYETIDAEALDELLADSERTGSSLEVSFRYAGYDVSVGRHSLSVTPTQ